MNGLATAVNGMLAIDAFVYAMSAALGSQRIALIDRVIAQPEAVDLAEVNASDSLSLLAGRVQAAAYICTAVLFLVWLFRVRANAELLSPWPHRHGKPWLILGWGVPVVAWWFPKQIMDDIWNASKPGAFDGAQNIAAARRPGLVWAWWIAWVITIWGSSLQVRLFQPSGDLASIRQATQIALVSDVLFVITAVLAVAVVKAISGFQEGRRSAFAPRPFIAG